jgi:hypothetical protein
MRSERRAGPRYGGNGIKYGGMGSERRDGIRLGGMDKARRDGMGSVEEGWDQVRRDG